MGDANLPEPAVVAAARRALGCAQEMPAGLEREAAMSAARLMWIAAQLICEESAAIVAHRACRRLPAGRRRDRQQRAEIARIAVANYPPATRNKVYGSLEAFSAALVDWLEFAGQVLDSGCAQISVSAAAEYPDVVRTLVRASAQMRTLISYLEPG